MSTIHEIDLEISKTIGNLGVLAGQESDLKGVINKKNKELKLIRNKYDNYKKDGLEKHNEDINKLNDSYGRIAVEIGIAKLQLLNLTKTYIEIQVHIQNLEANRQELDKQTEEVKKEDK